MTIENLQIEVQTTSEKAASSLEKLASVLQKIEAYGNSSGLDKLYQKLKKIASLDFSKSGVKSEGINSNIDKMSRSGAKTEKAAKTLGKIENQLQNTASDFSRLAKQNTVNTSADPINDVADAFSNLNSATASASKSSYDMTTGSKNLSKQTKKTNNSILQSAKTILLYSALFSAVSSIAKGVTTGFENIAIASKEANAVLTQYKTLVLQLSNSFGAAFIPVLQAIYPLIQILINALIGLANAINILFSAFNGSSTVTIAKKYIDDYAKSLGKLKGMAGMDQIHAIGNTYNYGDMFEQVEIGTSDVISSLLTIAEIAAVLGTLKIFKNAKKIVETISVIGKKLKTVSGICLAIVGAVEFVKGAMEAWTEGIDWDNLTQMLIGATFLVVGLGLAFGPVGLAIGAIIVGIALFITGLRDAKENGYSLKNIIPIIVGIAALFLVIGIAIGWIPALIAVAILAFVTWGDEIIAWFDNIKARFDGWITGIKDKIFNFFDNIIDRVKKVSPGIASVLDVIKNAIGSVFDSVKASIDWCVTLFQDFVKLIKDLFSGDFKAVWEDLKTYFTHFWQGIVNAAIVPLNFLISCFEALVNFFIRGINVIINGINKINFVVPDWVPFIGGNSVGFNISPVSEITLGRIQGYSAGGFPEDGLFIANHNELVGQFSNGKTAVVNNEQIIEGISRGVSDASSEQNDLLREQNKILTQLLRRSGNGTIPVSTITKGLERQNRRNGKVIVPIGT